MEQNQKPKAHGSKRIKPWHIISVGILLITLLIVVSRAGWLGSKASIEVEVAAVDTTTIIEKVSASGKIQPEAEIKLSPEVSGEIIELRVQEGDSVVKGQLLVRLRPDLLQAAVDRARATLNQQQAQLLQNRSREAQAKARYLIAKTNFERNQKLYEEKVISDLEFEQSRTDYEVAKEEYEAARSNSRAAEYAVASARASLQEAQDNLRRTVIYAPANGIISQLSVELGERVVGTAQMSGTELLRIANLNHMEVRVDVNENDIVKVSVGDTAIIDIDAFARVDKPVMGVVTAIANTAKQALTADAVTEFEVRIRILPESFDMLRRLSKQRYPLRPGMTAAVEIITQRKAGVVAVPLAAVTTKTPDEVVNAQSKSNQPAVSNGKEAPLTVVFVYKPETQSVELRVVETGISDFEHIEIIRGVQAGEQIVVAPFIAISKLLKDGQVVRLKAAATNEQHKDSSQLQTSP